MPCTNLASWSAPVVSRTPSPPAVVLVHLPCCHALLQVPLLLPGQAAGGAVADCTTDAGARLRAVSCKRQELLPLALMLAVVDRIFRLAQACSQPLYSCQQPLLQCSAELLVRHCTAWHQLLRGTTAAVLSSPRPSRGWQCQLLIRCKPCSGTGSTAAACPAGCQAAVRGVHAPLPVQERQKHRPSVQGDTGGEQHAHQAAAGSIRLR
jgi:hypothetical protein